MGTFATIVTICNGIAAVLALAIMLVKPVRDKMLGIGDIREGQRCLMRSAILRIYDEHRKEDCISAYEKENVLHLHAAYKALGGNSFIDDVVAEMRKWDVETTLTTKE